MKKILITGFEPFDQDPTNPSGDWINWMKEKTILDLNIHGLILPVTFSSAFEILKDSFNEFKPDIVVLTGLAKNRKTLTVERLGINWVDARIPDNDGEVITSKKINLSGPDGIFTTIDLEKICELAQNKAVEMKVSTSAGEYVCNDLLYKALYFFQDKNVQTTFIHLPGAENYDDIFLALENIVKGLSNAAQTPND